MPSRNIFANYCTRLSLSLGIAILTWCHRVPYWAQPPSTEIQNFVVTLRSLKNCSLQIYLNYSMRIE